MDEKHYNKPSVEAFNKWLEDWSNAPHLYKYSVHLTGAFCQNYFFNKTIDTNDVDVLLQIKPGYDVDYHELKAILQQALAIGFKYKLLLDIYLVEDALKFTNRFVMIVEDVEDNLDLPLEEKNILATELLPSLYEIIQDTTDIRNEYLSKNYEVLSKELTLPNNGS